MIAVVLACCTRDVNQAIRVLEWSAELGMNPYELVILCSEECNPRRLIDLGSKSFVKVSWINDVEKIDSNWHENGNHSKSAAGPNSLFRQAAWDFHLTRRVPFLFWEPDAVPCHRGWVKTIDSEWEVALASGKFFLGFEVNRKTHPGDVGIHMSGVAVYHPDLPQKANRAVYAGDVAFDIEGAAQIVPQMMPSRTIFHRYRPPSFETEEDFNARVPEGLALYHACKDGSIIPFLAKRLGIKWAEPPKLVINTQPLQVTPVPDGMMRIGNTISPVPGNHVVDIFIKTREHDFPWLEWCLKSINKFCSGFRRLNIRSPIENSDLPGLSPMDTKAIWDIEADTEPGYLWQQVCKLHADQYTDADYILFQDSDTIFTRPITPSDFIRNGKPIWQYTPLGDARSDQQIWVPVMEKFLGKKPQHEFMRRHPFIVPRWAFEEFRTFCKYRHGKSLEDYILGESDPANGLALVFSEWNCLGFFLWEYHRDKVEWVLDSDAGPACVYQGFTHGGEARKLEDIAKFKEILEGSTLSQQGSAGGGVTRPPLTLREAIEFIESQGGTVQMPVVEKKHKGRKKGSKNKPKPAMAVSAPAKDSLLLAIHSYPGANETFARHWPSYLKSGATRIVGIGTTDHGCEFPCESVEIGINAYMKIKEPDDHLCRRLIDTVKWCLTQPEQRFIISEYDTIFLKKLPHFKGINAHHTGGQINGSLTHSFHHNPWVFDRESGPVLLSALNSVLAQSGEYPNNSPDLFFGLACERAGIEVKCPWKMFTRNSLDSPGDLDLAVQAARDGVHVIHGVKHEWEYNSIMAELNGKHLELSHQVA